MAAPALLVIAPNASASQRSARDASSAPSWSSYFYPARVGRTCHEILNVNGVTGSTTLKVVQATRSARGTIMTIDESTVSQAGGKQVPTDAALHYTVTRSGQVVGSPSNLAVGGVGFHIVSNIVLPSIGRLVSGRPFVTTLIATLPLSKSDLSQLAGAMRPGQTSMQMAVSLKEKGSLVPLLKTPLGTLRNVLEVTTTYNGVKVTNAVPSAVGAFSTALAPQLKKFLNLKTWYANGIGPVQVVVSGFLVQVNSCTG